MQVQKRFLVDIIGIILILVLLIVFIVGTLVVFNVPERIRGSIYNEGEDGTSLFAGWLVDRGFNVGIIQSEENFARSGDAILFVLAPRSGFTSQELGRMDTWVQRGGTLIIAQDGRQPSRLPGRFGVGIRRLWFPVGSSQLVKPTFNWPFVGQAQIQTSHYVSSACDGGVVHMGDCSRPYLVGIGRGRGRVFIMPTVFPFTNEGIENAGNAQLVENMVLTTAVPGQRVLFDEYHHQLQLSWLFTTPTGLAFWLCLLALLLFVFWQNINVPTGRAKGTPRTRLLTGEVARRRNNLEGASRQFAQPEAIKNHYWLRLKRVLARRYGVDPNLGNIDFVEALKPFLDANDLGTIAYLLSHKEKFPPMTQGELRQWVSVIIDFTDSHVLTREIYEYQKTV